VWEEKITKFSPIFLTSTNQPPGHLYPGGFFFCLQLIHIGDGRQDIHRHSTHYHAPAGGKIE